MAALSVRLEMRIFSKIASRRLKIGGEQHSGWLPEGFSTPLPTPVREVQMKFEIGDDGGGNFLLLYSSDDKSVYGDSWHQSIKEAKEAAHSYFGIEIDEWEDQE